MPSRKHLSGAAMLPKTGRLPKRRPAQAFQVFIGRVGRPSVRHRRTGHLGERSHRRYVRRRAFIPATVPTPRRQPERASSAVDPVRE